MSEGSGRKATALHLSGLLLACAALWASRFSNYRRFGLYEDDIARVGKTFDMAPADIWAYVHYNLSLLGQGRPFHEIFIGGFAWLAGQVSDLPGLYLFGFGIVFLNLCLFSFLLRRLSLDPMLTGIGTLAFALYPTDTTQALLTHNLGLHPSLTFLLVGLHAYLSGWLWQAYPIVVVGCMITYEPVFPLFLVAPLLLKEGTPRHWLRHLVLCLGPAGLIYLKRIQLHSARISDVQGNPLQASLKSITLGPLVNLETLIARPFSTLLHCTPVEGALLVLWTALFGGYLFLLNADSRPGKHTGLLKFSVAALFLAYPVILVVPPWMTFGRGSRIHFAAIVGAVLLQTLALRRAGRLLEKHRGIFCLLTGSYLALLLGFGWQVQSDFVEKQEIQKEFWGNVVALAPDMEAGDLIVVEWRFEPSRSKPDSLLALSWSTVMIPEFMVSRERGGEPPKIAIVRHLKEDVGIDWETKEIVAPQVVFDWDFPNGARESAGQTIILRSNPWTRLSELERDGKTVSLKPPPPEGTRPHLVDGMLRKLLVPEVR